MTRLSDGGCGFVRRRNGMPFAEAITGTCRGPETFAYGRTLRTAFSGGRFASGCFSSGFGGGGGGGGRRVGGARVSPSGSVEISRVRAPTLAALLVLEASRWSRVWTELAACTAAQQSNAPRSRP